MTLLIKANWEQKPLLLVGTWSWNEKSQNITPEPLLAQSIFHPLHATHNQLAKGTQDNSS